MKEVEEDAVEEYDTRLEDIEEPLVPNNCAGGVVDGGDVYDSPVLNDTVDGSNGDQGGGDVKSGQGAVDHADTDSLCEAAAVECYCEYGKEHGNDKLQYQRSLKQGLTGGYRGSGES